MPLVVGRTQMLEAVGLRSLLFRWLSARGWGGGNQGMLSASRGRPQFPVTWPFRSPSHTRQLSSSKQRRNSFSSRGAQSLF